MPNALLLNLSKRVDALYSKKEMSEPDYLTKLHCHLDSEAKPTMLAETANSLLKKLYLQKIRLANNEKLKGKEMAKSQLVLDNCARDILILLENHSDKKARKRLQIAANEGDCEQYIHSSDAKRYFYMTIDSVINGVNAMRGAVFRRPYPYSRLAKAEFISSELHSFTMMTQQSTAGIVLQRLRPIQKQDAENESNNFLNEEILQSYKEFLIRHKKNKELLAEGKNLFEALNTFAKETVSIKKADALKDAAENAFIVSQDLVITLFKEEEPSTAKMHRLAKCFDKTATMIKKPGNRREIESLRLLMEKSDYQRYACDREKTCYAIIHILAAAALLALAIVETVTTGGINLMIESFTLAAEGISLVVGCGQLAYFIGSEEKDTLYNQSMSTLFKAARVEYNGEIHYPLGFEGVCAAINLLQANADKCEDPLLQAQAIQTLSRAKEFTADLAINNKTKKKQIAHLEECLTAANHMLQNPNDPEAAQQLRALANQSKYEQRRTDKHALLVGSLLLLVSFVIYLATITATILSCGATAGTIISAIMLSALAINKIVGSQKKDSVLFTDEAKKLGEYSEILFAKPVTKSNPVASTATPEHDFPNAAMC